MNNTKPFNRYDSSRLIANDIKLPPIKDEDIAKILFLSTEPEQGCNPSNSFQKLIEKFKKALSEKSVKPIRLALETRLFGLKNYSSSSKYSVLEKNFSNVEDNLSEEEEDILELTEIFQMLSIPVPKFLKDKYDRIILNKNISVPPNEVGHEFTTFFVYNENKVLSQICDMLTPLDVCRIYSSVKESKEYGREEFSDVMNIDLDELAVQSIAGLKDVAYYCLILQMMRHQKLNRLHTHELEYFLQLVKNQYEAEDKSQFDAGDKNMYGDEGKNQYKSENKSHYEAEYKRHYENGCKSQYDTEGKSQYKDVNKSQDKAENKSQYNDVSKSQDDAEDKSQYEAEDLDVSRFEKALKMLGRYPVSSGLCIIFSMEEDREGSQEDVKKVKELFEKKYRYDVIVQINPTSKDIQTFATKLQAPRNKFYDSLVIWFMGHGSLTHLNVMDKKIDRRKDFIQPLSDIDWLNKKPKLFFIQACLMDQPELTNTKSEDGSTALKGETDSIPLGIGASSSWVRTYGEFFDTSCINSYADTLIAYATKWFEPASRHGGGGSLYVETVVDVLKKCGHSESIENVLRKVHYNTNSVLLLNGCKTWKQTPYYESSLQKEFVFPLSEVVPQSEAALLSEVVPRPRNSSSVRSCPSSRSSSAIRSSLGVTSSSLARSSSLYYINDKTTNKEK